MSHPIHKEEKTDSFVYFNCEINNSGNNSNILAEYNQNFSRPIFEDATKYKFACVRFSINTAQVPITIEEVLDPSVSATTLPYSITLNHNGDISTVNLEWVTQSNKPTPNLTAQQDLTNDFYYLWNFDHFLDLINTALRTAYGNLAAPPGTYAPWFQMVKGSNKVELVAEIGAYDSVNLTAANRIDVYMNRRLTNILEHFKGIKDDNNDTLAFKFIIDNEGTNNDEGTYTPPKTVPPGTETYYLMQQYKPSFALFESFSRLLITSDAPFFRNEYFPSSIQNFGVPQTPPNSFLGQGARAILTDFVVPAENIFDSQSDTVIYVPDSYRYADILSKSIERLNFRILWVDHFGNTYPLVLGPNAVCTFKFAFVGEDILVNKSD